MTDDLGQLRLTVNRGMMLLLWAQLPLLAGTAWLADKPFLLPCLVGLVLAGIATVYWRLAADSVQCRVTIAIALVGMVSIILAICSGRPLQPDIHMYYFAILAMLAAYCDHVVIYAAAGAIAVHHLVLNFLAPELVFPGGGDFPRVILHAVIVAAEAGTLVWMTGQVVIPFKTASRNLAALAAAQAVAAEQEMALLAAERARAAETIKSQHAAALQIVVERLAGGLAELAKGDLLHRLTEPFAPDYERLRTDFNAAAAQLLDSMKFLVDCSGNIRQSARDVAGVVDELNWRNAVQQTCLGQAEKALAALTEAGMKSTQAVARSQAFRQDADEQLRSLLTNGLTESAADAMQRADARNAAWAAMLNETGAAAAERLVTLERVAAAMREMREVMADYDGFITTASQSSRFLVSEAEQLVDTVCEFNISEAAVRAAWKPAAA
jgi:methyl-accepting chemotaxis protein